MKRISKLWFLLFIALPCVGCDQAAKSTARVFLTTSGPTSYLNGTIRFEYVENPGAFLNLGADLPDLARFILFVVLAGGLLTAAQLVTLRQERFELKQIAGLALITGGGVGNLIDRIINGGRVGDFVSVGFGPIRTGIFNVADIAVLAGAIFLAYSLIWKQKTRSN